MFSYVPPQIAAIAKFEEEKGLPKNTVYPPLG